VLSDAGLTLFALPFLGPCKLQELNLSDQGGICHGIAALAGGRFPGQYIPSACNKHQHVFWAKTS
jgi:hypothetical protein